MTTVRDVRRLENYVRKTEKDIRRALQDRAKAAFKLRTLYSEGIAVGNILCDVALLASEVPKLSKDVVDRLFLLAGSLVASFAEPRAAADEAEARLVVGVLTLLGRLCATEEAAASLQEEPADQDVLVSLAASVVRLQSADQPTADVKALLLQPLFNLISDKEDLTFLQKRSDLYAAVLELLDSTEELHFRSDALAILDKLTEKFEDETTKKNIPMDWLENIIERKKEAQIKLQEELEIQADMIEKVENIRARIRGEAPPPPADVAPANGTAPPAGKAPPTGKAPPAVKAPAAGTAPPTVKAPPAVKAPTVPKK
ncbi:fibrous sheath CABYR-binding protein-like isoform X2 [Bacillus rossius redtenbacheri]